MLDAADFGVAQRRLRVFIVAVRQDFPDSMFPKPTHSRLGLLRAKQTGEYWDRWKISKRQREQLLGELPWDEGDQLLPWRTVRDALSGLPNPSLSEAGAWMNHWSIPGARSYPGHSGSVLDWPSKTIKAGVHGVPGGENTVSDNGKLRYYTLREAARIQTFLTIIS